MNDQRSSQLWEADNEAENPGMCSPRNDSHTRRNAFFARVECRGMRRGRVSENSIVAYGSALSSVDRVGSWEAWSDSLRHHMRYGSAVSAVVVERVDVVGDGTCSGWPDETHADQPFAPASPTRGTSDSQNSSRASRSVSRGRP